MSNFLPMAADIDPTSWGVEMWSLATGGIRNVKGELINEEPGRLGQLQHSTDMTLVVK